MTILKSRIIDRPGPTFFETLYDENTSRCYSYSRIFKLNLPRSDLRKFLGTIKVRTSNDKKKLFNPERFPFYFCLTLKRISAIFEHNIIMFVPFFLSFLILLYFLDLRLMKYI